MINREAERPPGFLMLDAGFSIVRLETSSSSWVGRDKTGAELTISVHPASSIQHPAQPSPFSIFSQNFRARICEVSVSISLSFKDLTILFYDIKRQLDEILTG
jgi:hypothetical protein